MTMIVNKSNRTLKLGGQEVGPSEFADVEVRDLQNHLFARSGLIEVRGGSEGGGRGRPKKQKQEPEPAQAEQSESESGE